MINRYDPFREALSLRRAMDQLFEQSFVHPGYDVRYINSGGANGPL